MLTAGGCEDECCRLLVGLLGMKFGRPAMMKRGIRAPAWQCSANGCCAMGLWGWSLGSECGWSQWEMARKGCCGCGVAEWGCVWPGRAAGLRWRHGGVAELAGGVARVVVRDGVEGV